MANISGTAGNDSLLGTIDADVIIGLEGDDTLDGGGSSGNPASGQLGDFLDGGPGSDTLQNGRAIYYSSPQGVFVNLSGSSHSVDGLPLVARTARDGYGSIDSFGDGILGGQGSQFDDVWYGSDIGEYDLLFSGNDQGMFGAGNDSVFGGSGNDTLDGGGGQDTLYFYDVGYDSAGVATRGIHLDLDSGIAMDGWGGTDHVANFEIIVATTGDDTIIGNDDANIVYLLEGNDSISGAGGDDQIGSRGGNDTADGGTGSDSFFLFGSRSDFLLQRIDTTTVIATRVNPVGNSESILLANFEFFAFQDQTIALRDVVDPGTDDTLDLSGPGGSTAAGGEGDDTYIVDNVLDVPVEQPGEGIDTVKSSISWTLGENLENLILTGTADTSGSGNSLFNQITGNSGRNTLDGGAGADTLTGGAGGDTYILDDPGDRVIEVAQAAALLPPASQPHGTEADADTIVATLGRAVQAAFVENGVLAEGSAARALIGNVLANVQTGNSAGNQLEGAEGNDTLNGGDGIDVAAYTGRRADFSITANAAGITVTDLNTVDGDEGTDTLTSVEALLFADEVLQLAGSTVASGSALGETLLLDDAGAQAVAGGAGNDTYLVNALGDVTIERAGGGADTVKSSVSWTLWEHVERLQLTGNTAIDGAGNSTGNQITGNSSSNRLTGYEGNDTLSGGSGADTLYGGTGNDALDGGVDTDVLEGGPGNDIYTVTAGDSITELSSSGTDTVRSSASWTLGANLERLMLVGSSAGNGTGNSAANALTGNGGANRLTGLEGADTLSGGGGNDVLAGGKGNDKLTGGTGADQFVFDSAISASTNKDMITDFIPGTDRIRLDADIFLSLAAGSLSPEQFYANAGATAAHDADDRIVYNRATGALYYDADGAGGSAAVQFAVLGAINHPDLSATDFEVGG